jgi:hypothetical protein
MCAIIEKLPAFRQGEQRKRPIIQCSMKCSARKRSHVRVELFAICLVVGSYDEMIL